MPTPEIARAVIRSRLANVGTRGMNWKAIDAVALGLSHSELTLACEHAAKQAILSKAPRVTTAVLIGALKERRRASGS